MDSGHETEGSKGFNHQRLDELDVTHHESKWGYSIGRITESSGGYRLLV